MQQKLVQITIYSGTCFTAKWCFSLILTYGYYSFFSNNVSLAHVSLRNGASA